MKLTPWPGESKVCWPAAACLAPTGTDPPFPGRPTRPLSGRRARSAAVGTAWHNRTGGCGVLKYFETRTRLILLFALVATLATILLRAAAASQVAVFVASA